ncbi:MAG TPA: hypothetical protein VM165_20895, partial [Planctomycetaceae bacterium]|nr:hypothetical protein [Planctomycetaceae bacterium]
MPPTTITTAEHFAIDGSFGPAILLSLGVALSLVFAWALRREAHVLGQRNVALFWGLRSVALAVVFWMLLAPMNVRVDTSTTRRAIAIATDVSGSMRTIDPVGQSDDLRWALSRDGNEVHTTTRSVDQAVAAIGLAQRHLQLAQEALQQHRQDRIVVEAVSTAHEAIERTGEHLQHVAEAPDLSDSSRTLANRLIPMLDGPEFQSFTQLSTALANNRTPSQKGWRESLPDLEHRVAGLRTMLQELARIVAEDESLQMARDNPALLTTVQNASRLNRAEAFVAALQTSALTPLQDQADVRFGAFDRAFHWLSGRPTSTETKPVSASSLRETQTVATGTDLSAVLDALQREGRDQPLAAVFLLSDVAHNQPAEKHPRDV